MINTSAHLYRILALRDDYPAGTCWAWIDSADRVCGKPDLPSTNEGDGAPHLCKRHAIVAVKRQAALVEKARDDRERAEAERARLLPVWRAELEQVERRMAQLDRSATTDPAVVNVPLAKRLPTDNQIHELAGLASRREHLLRALGVAA